MKVAFITGKLEIGRDGVGDYSRVLAGEILRQDARSRCCLIGLNDSYLNQSEPSRSEWKADEKAEAMPQLRLPPSLSWQERSLQARDFLNDFSPDWVSFQFVPYAFHRKGIVRALNTWIRPLIQNRNVHVMFHELWIGAQRDAPLRQRLMGAIQKHYVLQFLRICRPQVIHTSNLAYEERLRQRQITAEVLPLFANIPVTADSADAWLFPMLQTSGVNISSANRSDFWIFGFFGTLRADWSAEPLFGYLRTAAVAAGRRLIIASAGRVGNEPLWRALVERYSSDFDFIQIGQQSDARISEYLNSLDMGLGVSPLSLVEKSGAITAMLEHGLPVIVSRVNLPPAAIAARCAAEPLLYTMDETLPARLSSGLRRGAAQPRLPRVGADFLRALQQTGAGP